MPLRMSDRRNIRIRITYKSIQAYLNTSKAAEKRWRKHLHVPLYTPTRKTHIGFEMNDAKDVKKPKKKNILVLSYMVVF